MKHRYLISMRNSFSTNDLCIVFEERKHLISLCISSVVEIHQQASLDVDEVIITIYQEEEEEGEEASLLLYHSISQLNLN